VSQIEVVTAAIEESQLAENPNAAKYLALDGQGSSLGA
jgi:hypothetical protein